MNFQFVPKEFINNLGYMWRGMLAIMVVIGVIIAITTILNKVTGKKNK